MRKSSGCCSIFPHAVTLTLLMIMPAAGQNSNPCLGAAANKITCVLFQAVIRQSPPGTVPPPGPGIPSGNAVLISQLTAALPLPSPASGFTYTFDRTSGVYTRSTESFGPAVAERAETIGKKRASVGFAFERFVFDKADGVDIHNITILLPVSPTAALVNRENFGLSLNQYTVFATYGITDWVDISVGVPFNTVTLGISAEGNIGDFSTLLGQARRTARGIGDVTIQAKANVLKSERMALALGLAIRTPTGDAYDGLGAGAVGIRQFVVASYSRRWFAPHVNLGYEWNGSSILAGDFFAGVKASLPKQIVYAAGFDSGLTKRLTLNVDIVGRELFNAERVVNYWNIGNGPLPRRNVNITNEVVGFKVNVVGQLLFGANVLFRLNEGGLRSKVAPLFTLTYTL